MRFQRCEIRELGMVGGLAVKAATRWRYPELRNGAAVRGATTTYRSAAPAERPTRACERKVTQREPTGRQEPLGLAPAASP